MFLFHLLWGLNWEDLKPGSSLHCRRLKYCEGLLTHKCGSECWIWEPQLGLLLQCLYMASPRDCLGFLTAWWRGSNSSILRRKPEESSIASLCPSPITQYLFLYGHNPIQIQREGTSNHLLRRRLSVTSEEEQVRWEAIVAAIFLKKYNLPTMWKNLWIIKLSPKGRHREA